MRRLLQPFRFLIILFSIVIYLANMALVSFFVRGRWAFVNRSNRILSRYSRFGLWILNIRVKPLRDFASASNGLYVGNHLSYLDVLVVSSQQPSCFVTSVEVRDTPGLGLICRMAGCLFVERRNKENIRGEVAEITQALQQDLSVAIFPEATSTNGEQIFRFRRPLYMAAIDAQKPVIPFCLNYARVGGRPINQETRDSVFWYGDMDFIPHLWAVAGSGGIEVDLHFLDPIQPGAQTEPAQLAELSQAKVEEVFRPVAKV